MTRATGRAKAIAFIAQWAEKIAPKSGNAERLTAQLEALSDKEFHALMEDFRDGKDYYQLIVPNGRSAVLDHMRNIDLAKELDFSFFERVWMTNERTGRRVLTNKDVLILTLPLRLMKQTLFKKINLAADDKHIDALTQQVTSDSKGSSFSLPQTHVLIRIGLRSSLKELLSLRGGNPEAHKKAMGLLVEYGKVRLADADLDVYKTRATLVLSRLYTCQLLTLDMG